MRSGGPPWRLGSHYLVGAWVSPPDVVQGQFVRMLYIHPAVATMCYAGFGMCALASVAWLWPRLRSPRWDRLAVAGAEVGAVFCLATLVTGSSGDGRRGACGGPGRRLT